MELLDLLTDEDKQTLDVFIYKATNTIPEDMNYFLRYWNKNKRRMYKALGRNLRVKVPIDLKMTNVEFNSLLRDIYYPYLYTILDYRVEDNPSPFIQSLISYLTDLQDRMWTQGVLQEDWVMKLRKIIDDMIKYKNIKGLQKSYEFEWDFKNYKIPAGTKFIRALQKILKLINFPHMDLFEDFRNQISNLITKETISANLVFSIHPIDFLTISDNNCNWSSCMSWLQDGGYSAAVTEMMNSNMVIVCYLESNKPFDVDGCSIPNKSWRCLLYLHKNIIVMGKQYPYFSYELSKEVMSQIQKIVKKSLNWEYQYKFQQYLDTYHINSNDYIRDELDIYDYRKKLNSCGKERKSILIYTDEMYNDLALAPKIDREELFCCRNYVDKAYKLNASGPALCVHCGEKLENSGGHDKICDKCHSRICKVCGIIDDSPKYELPRGSSYDGTKTKTTIIVHKNGCICELFYLPQTGVFIPEDYVRYICKNTNDEKGYLSDRMRPLEAQGKGLIDLEKFTYSDSI